MRLGCARPNQASYSMMTTWLWSSTTSGPSAPLGDAAACDNGVKVHRMKPETPMARRRGIQICIVIVSPEKTPIAGKSLASSPHKGNRSTDVRRPGRLLIAAGIVLPVTQALFGVNSALVKQAVRQHQRIAAAHGADDRPGRSFSGDDGGWAQPWRCRIHPYSAKPNHNRSGFSLCISPRNKACRDDDRAFRGSVQSARFGKVCFGRVPPDFWNQRVSKNCSAKAGHQRT
jgi:hypothetical protein